jgi:hypothetical protein
MICAREPCSPSIPAALSELSRVVGRSSWASVRPEPDSDPGYTLVAPSALKSACFSALRKKQLVDRQTRTQTCRNFALCRRDPLKTYKKPFDLSEVEFDEQSCLQHEISVFYTT